MGFRHRIIHQTAGDELTVFIVNHLFEHGLGQALGNATVHLTVDNQGIDHIAAIIHGEEPLDIDLTRFRVNLHHTDVRAKRKRRIAGLKPARGLETWLDALRGAPGSLPGEIGRRKGDFAESYLLVRVAFHPHFAIGILDVFLLGVQHMGTEFLCLFNNLVNRHLHGRPADRQTAAAERPNAVADHIGIAVHNLDIFNRDAKIVRHNLGERGLIALAMR